MKASPLELAVIVPVPRLTGLPVTPVRLMPVLAPPIEPPLLPTLAKVIPGAPTAAPLIIRGEPVLVVMLLVPPLRVSEPVPVALNAALVPVLRVTPPVKLMPPTVLFVRLIPRPLPTIAPLKLTLVLADRLETSTGRPLLV